MYEIDAGQVMLSYYIKSKRLSELTAECFANTPMANATLVNIYIDMTDMVSNLYNPKVRITDYACVTSYVINLCAHLRSFYYNTCRCDTQFFIVYSDMKNTLQTKLIPEYNNKYVSKVSSNGKIRDMINLNLELLKTLCPYLLGIYFIESTEETAIKIFDIILKEEASGNRNPNIIITKDMYAYQIPANRADTVIFRPKKKDGQDLSWSIRNANIIQTYLRDTESEKTKSSETMIQLSDSLNSNILSLLLTLSNFPCRNIKSIYSKKVAVNKLLTLISTGWVINGYNTDPNAVYDALAKLYGPQPICSSEFAFRFKAIDLIFGHISYMNNPESLMQYKIDLVNNDEVRAINNKYFRSNPLDLNRL